MTSSIPLHGSHAVAVSKRSILKTVSIGGCCAVLLVATPNPATAQADSRPADADLRRRLEPLVPSFRAALAGDNVEAQRATLSIIADIPPAMTAETNLSATLAAFLKRD